MASPAAAYPRLQIMALSYAVIAPLVLPAALGFFLTAWVGALLGSALVAGRCAVCVHAMSQCKQRQRQRRANCCACAAASSACMALPANLAPACMQVTWRYCCIYFYERSYESGGRIFETLFTLMVWTLVGGTSGSTRVERVGGVVVWGGRGPARRPTGRPPSACSGLSRSLDLCNLA